MSTAAKSSQGSRVQQELEALRQKQLAKNRRDKLKDVCSGPLTTPEQAKAFLASMRDKLHQREFSHQPPTHLSADGMDAWYLQQRQREKELRERRREAEALLRGYRGGRESLGGMSTASTVRGGRESYGCYTPTDASYSQNARISIDTTGFPANSNDTATNPLSLRSVTSDSLDDPRSFRHTKGIFKQQQHNRSSDKLVGPDGPVENNNDEDDSTTEKKRAEDLPHTIKTYPSEESNFSGPPSYEPLTVWLDFISSEPGAKFPPEPGRYHLYLSYACPGSHRALIVRALKGLQNAVSVTYVHPCWRLTNPEDPEDKHRGWVFGDPNGEAFCNTIQRGGPFPPAYQDNEPDPVFNAKSIREIYENAGDTSGKYTIPLLWDKKQNTIVNNESSDIAYMLNSCFNDYAEYPELDLYTEYDEEGIAKLNEVIDWLSPLMIHGVYRCGFAKNQEAYDKAIAELCDAFDRADDILQKQRYLTGNDVLTDADIRLFVSLIRFDEVYAVYFKANARLVMLTPALLNFCREIYQIPGIAETCNMEQIKAHFYASHAEWNKYSVIPRGLGFLELLDMEHDRHLLSDDNEFDVLHEGSDEEEEEFNNNNGSGIGY